MASGVALSDSGAEEVEPEFPAKLLGQPSRLSSLGVWLWKLDWLGQEYIMCCPVVALHRYLRATGSVTVDAPRVDSVSLVPCFRAHVSQVFCDVIKSSQSAVYTRAHNMRKYTALAAVFGDMYWADIQAREFWWSNYVLAFRYLMDVPGPL